MVSEEFGPMQNIYGPPDRNSAITGLLLQLVVMTDQRISIFKI